MSMKSIRRTYGVPAKRGARVRWHCRGWDGVIVGSVGRHLLVRFDGVERTTLLHPAWKVEYLPVEVAP